MTSVVSRFPRYWRKLSWILREEGVLSVVSAAGRKPINYCRRNHRLKLGASFDDTLGLDTGYRDEEEDKFPAMIPETQQGYDPVAPDTFRKALDLLAIPFGEFSFIDLGSGKGRAVLIAADFPFERVVGVEYSPHYHEVACRNLEVYGQHSDDASRIDLVNGDAAEFRIPAGKSVVFLFNPFQGQTFNSVVANLEHALESGAEEIYVVYVNPLCRRVLDKARGFKIVHDEKNRDPYRAFAIYHGVSNEALLGQP